MSRYLSGEPYFGKNDANRFDDYRRPESIRFGTCYLGGDIVVAFAETVLHDEVAVNGQFKIASSEVTDRRVVTFTGTPLTLADFTGVALKRMGLDGSFSTVLSYRVTKKWAVAIHSHPAHVDGFLYVSRHINTGKAVVLFDRAASKLQVVRYQALLAYPGATDAINALGVDFT